MIFLGMLAVFPLIALVAWLYERHHHRDRRKHGEEITWSSDSYWRRANIERQKLEHASDAARGGSQLGT